MMDELLIRKLQIQPGMRGTLLFSPPGFVRRLEHPGIHLDAGQRLDFLLLFVSNAGELQSRFLGAHRRLRYDGLLWICFPKPPAVRDDDLSHDNGWSCVTRRGLAGVARVSLDVRWAATRFRPRERLAR